ncbi:hypothetical protein ACFW04_013575 [Cataglyphis niger]
MNINILQWNCRSLQRRNLEIAFLLDKFNINIVAFCETRLNEHFRPIVNNFDIYSCDRNRQGSGIGILIEKNLDSHKLLMIIYISFAVKIILNLFLVKSGSVQINPFTSALSLYFDPVVICGDVNGKSSLWSSNISGPDHKESLLENAISQLNLSCLNDGNYTTCSSIDFSSTSALDITLTSLFIAHKCSEMSLMKILVAMIILLS